MRIAPHELGDHPLDLDLLARVVLGRERVMREHLTAADQQGETGDEHHDRALHEPSPCSRRTCPPSRLALRRVRLYVRMIPTNLLPAARCPLPAVQAVIRRLDEHVGGPRSGGLAVPPP